MKTAPSPFSSLVFFFPAIAAVVLLLVGCGTSPRDGSDEVARYYGRVPVAAPAPAPGVATVQVAPAAEPGRGPANVAHIVYFAFDRSELLPQYRSVVEQHADFLRANTGRRVLLEGHTDERGGTEYNLALGQRRAEVVRRSLVLLGVAESQLESISFGEEKPASPLQTEEGYQLNRRVEFNYR